MKASVISNIIVLMMENRSFDHLLGWLKLDSNSGIEGLIEGMTVPRDPSNPNAGSLPVTRAGYDVSPDDPKHDFNNVAIQINNDSMDGFVYDSIMSNLNESNPVSMFDSTSAPIINTLAKEFAVFDHWFASIPGPTDPNRQFAMSGTSMGYTVNFNGSLYPQQSYFDYLRTNNHSFAGYYQDDLWLFGQFEDLLKPENSVHIKSLEDHFFADVAQGMLPEFTWLQPRMTTTQFDVPTWQHPDASVLEGERLIKEIYEAIRAGPKWKETLFIITYDEHGGFYDHVAPPSKGVPSPDGIVASNGYAFDTLGVRLPTLAISPWISAGLVVSKALPHEQPTTSSAFDSTSIMATANKILGLTAKGIAPLGERMAWANTFAGLVDPLSPHVKFRADCIEKLPELPPTPSNAAVLQRMKPLNDHMEGQLLFFCVMNHQETHLLGKCPGRTEIMVNQGLASDWIRQEHAVFQKKQRSREALVHPSI